MPEVRGKWDQAVTILTRRAGTVCRVPTASGVKAAERSESVGLNAGASRRCTLMVRAMDLQNMWWGNGAGLVSSVKYLRSSGQMMKIAPLKENLRLRCVNVDTRGAT